LFLEKAHEEELNRDEGDKGDKERISFFIPFIPFIPVKFWDLRLTKKPNFREVHKRC
jgi:hypothetical protein